MQLHNCEFGIQNACVYILTLVWKRGLMESHLATLLSHQKNNELQIRNRFQFQAIQVHIIVKKTFYNGKNYNSMNSVRPGQQTPLKLQNSTQFTEQAKLCTMSESHDKDKQAKAYDVGSIEFVDSGEISCTGFPWMF